MEHKMDKKLIVNVDGTEEMVDLTAEEQKMKLIDYENSKIITSSILEENKKNRINRESALAKLAALGLTPEEIAAL